MIGRALRVVVPIVLVVVVGAGLWMAFTGSRAVAAVNDLQQAVDDVQMAIDATDLPALRTSTAAAQDAARRANDSLDGPVWGLAAAIPYLGDTPQVARTTAAALARAADGLTPLLEVADVLDPASLYSDGRVAVEKLRAAAEPLSVASADLDAAAATIATAPTTDDGAWVPASLDAQRADAAAQLTEAASALETAAAAADVLPALLGADGPRTWFVGLQTPAEARGTGGLPGNFVILRADDGRLELVETGSNDDFDLLDSLPEFPADYSARYGDAPALFQNSNLSPHFPYAGQLWKQFSDENRRDDVDVVLGTDVVALGAIAKATGRVTLPDGRQLSPAEVVEFALVGVYEEFPDRRERKAFQEAVATSVFEALTSGDVDAEVLVAQMGRLLRDQRLTLWSPDAAEQATLSDIGIDGSITAEPGHYAYAVVNNASGSKLDTYLDRGIVYDVGRCETDGRVSSVVEVTLTSDIPRGAVLPDFVLAQAEPGPRGPVSRTQLQVHLSAGAVIESVRVDGTDVGAFAFDEEGRPSALVLVETVPRRPVTTTVQFTEPVDSGDPQIPVQPLVRDADVQTVEVPCPGS